MPWTAFSSSRCFSPQLPSAAASSQVHMVPGSWPDLLLDLVLLLGQGQGIQGKGELQRGQRRCQLCKGWVGEPSLHLPGLVFAVMGTMPNSYDALGIAPVTSIPWDCSLAALGHSH